MRVPLLVGLGLLAASQSAAAVDLIETMEAQRIAGIEKAIPSTVCVFVPGGGGGGSGVLVSPDGLALTNFHVTSPAGTYMRCGLADGNVYDAVVLGVDPVGDLAMIQLLGRDDFPTAEFVDSRQVRVGDWCFASGNPFLLATNLQPTITYGIISGTRRYQYPSGTLLEYGSCFQTDASINPGNSGGPLYAASGDLIGINGRCSFEKRGRVNVGVGYAISGNQARNFLGCLHSGRVLDHATLGATVSTDDDGRVTVTNILESSDGYRRGLRYGDEILEVDGAGVQTANDLQNLLATFPDSWRVKLTYRHDGERRSTLVRLASVHSAGELLEKMAAALPPPPPAPPGPAPDEETPEDGEPGSAPEDAAKPPRDSEDEETDDSTMLDASGQPIPKSAAERIELREGYSNFYFNRLRQATFIERLGKQFPANLTSESVVWTLKGTAAVGLQTPEEAKPVEIVIGPDRFEMKLDGDEYRLGGKGDLISGVDAGDAVGLLATLHAWRRMLELKTERFGDVFYWGTMPLAGERPLRDATFAVDAAIEFRFLQHPETGRLEVIEALADRDGDPAELWIDGSPGLPTEPIALTAMPRTLELRYGLESKVRVRLEEWTATKESASDEPPADLPTGNGGDS